MTTVFKKFFIPHRENNYQPHILQAKRFWFYAALAFAIKAMLIFFVLLLPAEAFLMPDILAVEQSKIILLTNNLRVKEGLQKLSENNKLNSSAGTKAGDMAHYEYFSHISPGERPLSYFLSQAGYKYMVAGENLAMGYFDAESMIRAWRASPTHRANLLDKDFTEIGTALADGMYDNSETVYAVQHFGKPRAAKPAGANSVAVSTQISPVDRKDLISTTTVKQVLSMRAIAASTKNSTADAVINPKPSLWHKYAAANNMLGSTLPVFGFSGMVYLLLIAFFTVALALNIFVEIKMQHRYVIVRSLALIGILAGLWMV